MDRRNDQYTISLTTGDQRLSAGRSLAALREEAAEGGCGVIGIASSEAIAGKHLLQALAQMSNRGNGKGGGIAAVGLAPEAFGVTREIMDHDYLLAIAYLDDTAIPEVERQFIEPVFEIDARRVAPHLPDHTSLSRLDVKPPEVVQYFVRIKDAVYETFRRQMPPGIAKRKVEDELVYQNSTRLNQAFYAAGGETRAFVLSHAKNLLVLKMVGYGDDVVRYYQLEDVQAHVWIGHHRYPTKGRVWHPGGAHPFIGMNEALVHNGDFANYASIAEYLRQRDIPQLFLTDTEVSVQVFDLLYRQYNYPLEYVIEALAPTTERDFAMLPEDKQRLYRQLQSTHMHASPDGPWFFLIAQSDVEKNKPVYRLTGITDTSMLRPQVFALQQSSEDGPAIGFAASEKQAIDAALQSLAGEDNRFWGRADRYWNARGGSHTDGGAFMFSVHAGNGRPPYLTCTDKFGEPITVPTEIAPPSGEPTALTPPMRIPEGSARQLFEWALERMDAWDYTAFQKFLKAIVDESVSDSGRQRAWETLSLLLDRRYPAPQMRRSVILSMIDRAIGELVAGIRATPSERYLYSSGAQPYGGSDGLAAQNMVLDCKGFEPEGLLSAALEIVRLAGMGFRSFIVVNAAGHRFIGNGLGASRQGLRIEVFGSSGDYLASGVDGVEVIVHGSAQDQLAQIMKSGKLVVHGDVGQTFGYAAKGGQVYILGNAAGRPMINAVGRPRVVINGTCLDYLAESFMAGDPHNDGGFIILNGMQVEDDGQISELDTPYPGSNLFSLASGGAIYVRDPQRKVSEDQLNGGEFAPFEERDWRLILPYLQENERLFGIPAERLLTVKGKLLPPEFVYRKIRPVSVRALQAEEAWVHKA